MELPHQNPLMKEKGLGDKVVVIRPELHAPEVDEYDAVYVDDIIGKIEIGSYVEYTLS